MNPLLADIGDIIGLIVTLAIIGFSVLSQVLGGAEKAKQQQQARRRQQQQGRARAPQPNSIESEIEAFLRQARGDGPATPPPAPESFEDQPVRTLADTPMEVDADDLFEPGEDFGRELSSHVQSHIGQDSISTRDAHLGDYVEAADERVEKHLDEVFDHQVGHLAHVDETDNTSEVAEGTDAKAWERKKGSASIGEEIAAMMKSPDTVRRMFIVQEIFKRPEI